MHVVLVQVALLAEAAVPFTHIFCHHCQACQCVALVTMSELDNECWAVLWHHFMERVCPPRSSRHVHALS
jgi:hypothetical protein